MSTFTAVSYKGTTYNLKLDGWLNHLDSDIHVALAEIDTDEIIIMEDVKVRDFKKITKDSCVYEIDFVSLHPDFR